MSTTRLEAFSDGVIAIAITLLVLDIRVPKAGSGALGHELLQLWPNVAAYVVSFLTIGVIWINHHAMLRRVQSADHRLLVLNLLLLLSIGILPFTTALLAEYLREPGAHLAAAIYAGSYLLMALAFYAMQRHVLYAPAGLRRAGIDRAQAHVIDVKNRAGLLPYLVAVLVAPVSAYLTLGLCAAVAVFYGWPTTTADAAMAEPA